MTLTMIHTSYDPKTLIVRRQRLSFRAKCQNLGPKKSDIPWMHDNENKHCTKNLINWANSSRSWGPKTTCLTFFECLEENHTNLTGITFCADVRTGKSAGPRNIYLKEFIHWFNDLFNPLWYEGDTSMILKYTWTLGITTPFDMSLQQNFPKVRT